MKPRKEHKIVDGIEYKFCAKCDDWLTLDLFYKNVQAWDELHCHCIKCKTTYNKKTYYKDSKLKDSIVKKNKERQKIVRQYVFDYLSTHPCIDCGERDPVVLEFDHQHDKTRAVAILVRDKCSLQVVKTEIEKCLVRCANCHRRKTAKDFGWYKDLV